jgi:hypothetical protein
VKGFAQVFIVQVPVVVNFNCIKNTSRRTEYCCVSKGLVYLKSRWPKDVFQQDEVVECFWQIDNSHSALCVDGVEVVWFWNMLVSFDDNKYKEFKFTLQTEQHAI